MVKKVSISNLEDFKKAYKKAPDLLKMTLRKAFPQFYAKMQEGYKEAIDITNKLRAKQPHVEPKVNKPSLAKTVGTKAGRAAGGLLRGAGRYVAPLQGIANIVSPESDKWDKLAGAGMVGTGIAALGGVALAPEIAGSLVLGDTLKKYVAGPLGNTIGNAIYKNNDPRYNFQSGDSIINQYDLAPELAQLTPEQQELVTAYNKRRMDELMSQAQQGIEANKALQNEYQQGENRLADLDRQLGSDQYGGTYTPPAVPTSQPVFDNNVSYPIFPQNVQNAQQGGLNKFQDTQILNSNQPVLNSIVDGVGNVPINYSNEYLTKSNALINELKNNAQQRGIEMSANNPYNIGELRGYAPVDNVQAGQLVQPSGIDYADILRRYQEAARADQVQNMVNSINNAHTYQTYKAPIYVVGPQGQLAAIQQDQTSAPQQLPTNTSFNTQRLTGELGILQAQQKAKADLYAQQMAEQKALLERQQQIDTANALGSYFNADPRMFLDTDIAKAAMQYAFNPNIQAQANINETIGKAPTQAQLKQAEQAMSIGGQLDLAQLNQQYNMMIQNAKDNAAMARTQAEQMGMNKRAAAQIESQAYIQSLIQSQENLRQQAALSNAVAIQQMKGEQGKDVANIYANRPSGSSNALTYEQQLVKGMVEQGMPPAQILKTMQGLGFTNFGLTPEEQAEMNR